MDLCDGDNIIAEEIMYFSRLRGYIPAVTPTLGHALVDMAEQDKNSEAIATLFNLERGAYRIQYPTLDPISRDPSLIRVNTGIAWMAAEEIIRELGLTGGDKTTALVIAEAAVMQARSIVLDESEMTNLDPKKINAVLVNRGLATLRIMSSTDFYGYVSGQRE